MLIVYYNRLIYGKFSILSANNSSFLKELA